MATTPVRANEKCVPLLRDGDSQSLRIPREFELPGEEAVIRKEGHRLVIEPVDRADTFASLIELLRDMGPLEDDFPEIKDLPPEPVDL